VPPEGHVLLKAFALLLDLLISRQIINERELEVPILLTRDHLK
jgi:hypothetical protein